MDGARTGRDGDGQADGQDLFEAARVGNLTRVKELVVHRGDGMQIDPQTGLRAIAIAARAGHDQCVDALTMSGIASMGWADTRSKMGAPAHEAAAAGKKAALETLIRRGANPNAKDGHGRSALHWAALAGCHECARILLPKCDAGEPDREGWTPLMLAAHGGHVGAVRELARHGQLARRLPFGERLDALELARRAGKPECVELMEAMLAKRPTSG